MIHVLLHYHRVVGVQENEGGIHLRDCKNQNWFEMYSVLKSTQ